jgi:hypothetical protein
MMSAKTEIDALEDRILHLEFNRIKAQEPLLDVEISTARKLHDGKRAGILTVQKLISQIAKKHQKIG